MQFIGLKNWKMSELFASLFHIQLYVDLKSMLDWFVLKLLMQIKNLNLLKKVYFLKRVFKISGLNT